MGVDYVRFALVSAGKEIQDKLYSKKSLESILTEIDKAKKLTDDSFFIIEPETEYQLIKPDPQKEFSLCYWSLLTLTIDVDGNIYSCPEMKHDTRFMVGNIRETPLAELICSEKRWYVAQQTFHCSNCCHIKFNNMLKRHFETISHQMPFI
jgi:radical SAM protein with 4Fe4S-binding SPASM domain